MRKRAMSILALLLLLTTLLPSNIIARANDNSSLTSVPANWPVTYTPYTDANDNPIYDPAEEPGISPDDVDFTSGTDKGRGNLPSFYVAADNSNLFFRMRLKSDPRDRKGGFLSSVWLVHLIVNGEIKATVGLDGKSPSDDFVYVAKGDGTSVLHIYDTDTTGGSVPGTRVVEAENGQYFLDFQVPIAKISELVQGISETTPLQFHFATSKAANLSVVNKDGKDDSPSEGKVIQMNALPPSIDIDGGNSKTYNSTTGFTLSGTTSIVSGQGSIDIDGTSGTFNISNNRWTFNLPTTISSTNGTYTASVTVTDSNGKSASDTQEINIVTGNKGLITIDGGAKATTNSTSPVISGIAGGQNGSKVSLFIDGKDVSGKINANGGTWETTGISLPSPSNGKEYNIEAKYTNSNGTIIYSTAIQKLTYQSAAATINLPTVSIGTITGDAILTISGTSNNANQIELQIDNVTVGIVPPDSTGSWTVSLEKPLGIGNHEIKAIATNSYGSKAVASNTYTVNTTSLSIENGLSVSTNDNQPTIKGDTNASDGSTVTITFTNQGINQESYNVNSENGRWTLEYPLNKTLNDGTYSVTAGVGGVSVTQQITIDTTTNVSILSPDAQTNNTNPVISGTAESNATVTLNIDNGDQVDTVFANDNGDWSYSPQNDLTEATHTVQVTASDVNGNVKSAEKAFTIKSTPSPAPSVQVQKPDITEAGANDGSISEQQVVTISDGTFAADLSKDDIEINGLPDGLDFTVTRDGDTQFTIGFTGKATSHTSENNAEVTVAVLSSGVLNGTAKLDTGLFTIHFSDPAQEERTLDKIIVNKDDSKHQGDYSLSPDETYQTTVIGVYSDQSQSDVTSVATYFSSDSNVVTVSEEGLVTAKTPGEATITISYGVEIFTQKITVTSSEPPFTLALDVNPDSIVGDGQSQGTITATVLSKDESQSPVEGAPVSFVLWDGTTSDQVSTNAQGHAVYTFTAPAINSIEPVEKTVKVIAQDTNTGNQAEKQIEIRFNPPEIQGVLIDKITGKSIEGADITVTAKCGIEFTTNVKSLADGSYTVIVPSSNCKYDLEVKKQIQVGNRTINVNTNQTVDVGNVDVSGKGEVIKPKSKITGQLLAKGSDNSSESNSYTELFGKDNVKVYIHGNSVDKSVSTDSNGNFNFNDVPLGKYHISYQITASDGTVLAGPGATVNVTQEGEVSVVYDLIDPYGVVKDSNGQPLRNVHMELYWADTDVNKTNGRIPGTMVNLPSLPNYPPNQNANPQVTNAAGEYGWMVPANGDYYIIATKSGYNTYDSRVAKPNNGDATSDDSYIRDGIIHIGSTIQSLDFQLEKKPISGGTPPSFNLPAPHNLKVTDLGVNKVTLEWDSVVGAASYNIYQDGKLITTGITDVNDTVIGLDPETTYQFVVTAAGNGQESVESNAISATTLAKSLSGEHHLYIHGYEDGTFKPERNVTRAEVAAMLYNLLQLNHLDGKVKEFPDVSNNYWAKHAIDAVYRQDLMVGYTDSTFKPNEPITRAELATVIAKVKHMDIDTPNPFSDTKNNWARKSISLVSKLGIMVGYTDGTFKPNQYITRVETVIALNRMAQRGPLEKVNQSTWPDVKSNYWGFKDIEEASMDHQYIVENDVEVIKQDQ